MSKTKFCSYLRESLRFDRASKSSRDRVQQIRLNQILQALKQTALYQERIQSGLHPNGLDSLQCRPVTKSDYRRHYPTGVLSRSPEKDWRYLSTSGTTDRLSVVADFVKRDHRRSSELRGLSIAVGAAVGIETIEIPPNVCNVVCGIDDSDRLSLKTLLWNSLKQRSLFQEKTLTDVRGRFERDILLRKKTLLPIEPAPASQLLKTLDEYLQILKKHDPQIIRGYPQYLLWLADRAKQVRFKLPRLSHLIPYGGLASQQMIERIEAGFQAPFRNVYGTSELGLIAASCGQSPGMHILEDLFLIQIDGSAGMTTRGAGNLIVTDLINTAMPMVRYQVGDIGRLFTDECPCGRKTARMEVQGRLQETIYNDGQAVAPDDVADTFYVDQGIANARLEEVAPTCFEADIVPTPGGTLPDLKAWEERFRQLLAVPVKRIKSRMVPFLRPETSGKYLMVWPYR